MSKLKKQVAEAERERDDAKAQLKAEDEEPFNFGEMSSTIVKYLVYASLRKSRGMELPLCKRTTSHVQSGARVCKDGLRFGDIRRNSDM